MIAFYLENKDDFTPAVRHVFYTLGKITGIEFREIDTPNITDYPVVVVYGNRFPKTAAKAFYINKVPYENVQQRIGSDQLLQQDIGLFDFARLREQPESRKEFFTMKRNGIYCMVDIIAGMLFFLSLENERQTAQRDAFGRFQKDFSPLDQSIYDVPVVDRMAKFFRDMLLLLAPDLRSQLAPLWPNQHKCALALSHDVDRIRSWTISKAKRYLKTPEPSTTAKVARIAGSSLIPANWSGNFRFITKIENSYHAESTLFFVALHRVDKDPRYALQSPRLWSGMRHIVKRGSAVGLHGTIPAAENADFILDEKKSLQKKTRQHIIGCRQHYLTFNVQRTWQAMAQAGMGYDSTVGFGNHSGYRCGTGFPYYPFDMKTKGAIPVLEIPLVVMDTVLFLDSKQNLTPETAWECILPFLENTEKNNSCLTINWHNSDVFTCDPTGFSQLYEKILQWGHEHNAWMTSLDHIYQWWTR